MAEGMRDRILDAAERLLARLGYRKMAMDDVAQEASISKRTIYLHFPSKEELTLSTIDRIVDRLLAGLGEIAAAGGAADAKVRRMLLLRVLFRFDSVRDYHASLDELLREIRPAYMARRSRYFAAEAAVFSAVLAEGIADGTLARADPAALADTLLLATNALLPSSLSPRELGERDEVEARAAGIADLLIHGLRRRPPS
ncbi:HTH-type transcriptional regulator EthR [Aquisphaera giovannonii]|uniref:HTH-type transcriptional regulator EthR n=1 Tax=Aquisphaera giovannonii TaxID=406548 RepID=A0A5B9WEE7_9BACT|nr:TetR/AcrR family transcriptional regulator [Aquisphaera giovannonii]QEH38843.1 HTH-type transcriptional regulator EthR [Aquisphaera giovannonii]